MTNTPAPPSNRLHIIDAIRGLAVLGILLANIFSWSGYKFILLTTIETLPFYEWDALLLNINHWLVDGKFYAIFSILFGAGFGLQYVKNQERMSAFLPTYRRRLCFLLFFGALHTVLWSGDILVLYGLLAFVLVSLRNTSYNKLLPLAIALLCFFTLPQTLMLLLNEPAVYSDAIAHKSYSDITAQALTDSFGNGTWSQVMATNLHNLYWRWLDFFPNGRISRVLGLFVLGFYLARSNYFSLKIYSMKLLLAYIAIGIISLTAVEHFNTNNSKWAVSGLDVIMKLVLVFGQVALALAYMSLLAQVFKRHYGEIILYPLTQIGRMAFTNYLMQTAIGITLFYGVGLGYWGSLGLAQLWILAILIYSGQVLFSSMWLKIFKQGPIEWLWGCLTAGKFRPNRRSFKA